MDDRKITISCLAMKIWEENKNRRFKIIYKSLEHASLGNIEEAYKTSNGEHSNEITFINNKYNKS